MKYLYLFCLLSFTSFATTGIQKAITYKGVSFPNAFFVIKGFECNSNFVRVTVCAYQDQATYNADAGNDIFCRTEFINAGANAKTALFNSAYTALLNQIGYFSGGSAVP